MCSKNTFHYSSCNSFFFTYKRHLTTNSSNNGDAERGYLTRVCKIGDPKQSAT